jgi:hypothetical protein
MRPRKTSKGFLVWLVVLAAGCGDGEKPPVETAEVSGQVIYRGEPLPGGQVTFTSADGEVVKNAIIDENGNYKIEAPVGDVKIAVNNQLLKEWNQRSPVLKRPGAPKPTRMKGTYVLIDRKYYSPETSGLTYTVKKGPQTHTIRFQ